MESGLLHFSLQIVVCFDVYANFDFNYSRHLCNNKEKTRYDLQITTYFTTYMGK